MKKPERNCTTESIRPGNHGKSRLSRLSLGMVLVYVLLLLPVLWIGKYDFPSADDFSMGLGTRLVFDQTGSVWAVLGKTLTETVRYYRTWIGYFTSCLFTVVSPATFGEGWYRLTPALVLLGLHIGVIAFLYALMERALGMSREVRRCMTVLVLFLMIQTMPEGSLRVEAFYWYSGAGNYTLTFSLGLLYLSCLILAVFGQKKKLFLALAAVTGFFAGGGNYLSALFFAIVTAVLAVLLVLGRSGKDWNIPGTEKQTEENGFRRELRRRCPAALLLPMILFFVGFAFNCAAPGNRIRGGEAAGFGAVKSVLLSLYYTLSYPLGQWMNWAVLLLLLMAGAVFWMGFEELHPSEQGEESFRSPSFSHPFLLCVFGYGLVSATVTPALYAQGNMDAGRIQSTFWLHWVLVLVLLEWYLVGGLHRLWKSGREAGREACSQNGKSSLPLAFLRTVAFFFVAFSLLAVKANPDFYTFTAAVSELADGSAAQYGREQEERLALLKDPEEKNVILPRYTVQPDLLFFADVSADPMDWANLKMSEYYGKDSIRGE